MAVFQCNLDDSDYSYYTIPVTECVITYIINAQIDELRAITVILLHPHVQPSCITLPSFTKDSFCELNY